MKWISAKTKGLIDSSEFVYFSDVLELPQDPALEDIADDSAGEYEAIPLLGISREILNKDVLCSVTADSGYVLWVNGQFIATGKFTDPFSGTLFDQIDITNALQPGNNQILFLVSGTKNDTANIAFEIKAEDTVLLASSSYTRYALGTQYHTSDMLFDYYASESMQLSWTESVEMEEIHKIQYRTKNSMEILPRCDVSVVAQGVYLNADSGKVSPALHMKRAFLSSQEIDEMTEDGFRFTAPDRIPSDGIYLIIDLGAEETGYFDMEIEASYGTEIQTAFGEHLDDLRVQTKESRPDLTAVYKCRGDKTEHFTYFRKPITCRYIQLFVAAKTFALYYAGLLPCRPAEASVGTFTCSDVMHRMIYQTALRTEVLCMREDVSSLLSSASMLDLRNQMLCNYYTYGTYSYGRTWLRLLSKRQRSDGLLEKRWYKEPNLLLPQESLIWIIALYEYVLYSGDLSFAEEVFPVIERMLRTFWMSARGQDVLSVWKGHEYGCIDVNKDDLYGNCPDAQLTLFYILALRGATQIARWLNRNSTTEDETDYREASSWYSMLADSAQEAFHKIFWCEETGMYADYIINEQPVHYTEFTQALALYADTVPEAIQNRILQGLISGRTSDIPVRDSSAEELLFKYEALLANDSYVTYVLDAIQKRFGSMLLKGATTFWEDPAGKKGTRCIGSGAVPVVIYGKYILGAMPTQLGFSDYAFKPVSSGLICTGTIPRASDAPLSINVSPAGFEVQ